MAPLRTALALTLTAAAAALAPAAVAGPAAAAQPQAAPAAGSSLPLGGLADALPTQSVTGALASGIGPLTHLTLDPLSNTGVDPLDNGVGSQIADFKPLSTGAVTKPITDGGSLATLPLVGRLVGLLPG